MDNSLTKNRLGIFIFQYRIPKSIRENNPDQKPLIRKSLQTRNRCVALKLAEIMEENNSYLELFEQILKNGSEYDRVEFIQP